MPALAAYAGSRGTGTPGRIQSSKTMRLPREQAQEGSSRVMRRQDGDRPTSQPSALAAEG